MLKAKYRVDSGHKEINIWRNLQISEIADNALPINA